MDRLNNSNLHAITRDTAPSKQRRATALLHENQPEVFCSKCDKNHAYQADKLLRSTVICELPNPSLR